MHSGANERGTGLAGFRRYTWWAVPGTNVGVLILARARGQDEAAAKAGSELEQFIRKMGTLHETSRVAADEVIEAALATGDVERARQFLTVFMSRSVPRQHVHLMRFEPRMAALEGDAAAAEAGFRSALAALREMDAPFFYAAAAVDFGELLANQDRLEESAVMVTEARAIFERLRAQPWLDRIDRLSLRPERLASRGAGDPGSR